MAHAFDHVELRARDGLRGGPSALGLEERVAVAVDDHGQDLDRAQRLGAIARRHYGQQLTRDTVGVVAGVPGAPRERAEAVLVEREAGRADDVPGVEGPLLVLGAGLRRRGQQGLKRLLRSGPTFGPTVDMIDVRLRTRPGWPMTRV